MAQVKRKGDFIVCVRDDDARVLPTAAAEDSSEEEAAVRQSAAKRKGGDEALALNAKFDFVPFSADKTTQVTLEEMEREERRKNAASTVEAKIRRAQRKLAQDAVKEEDEEDDDDDGDEDGDEDDSSSSGESEERAAASSGSFFDRPSAGGAAAAEDDDGIGFEELNLSRPLLKAIRDAGWVHPTPIQKSVVPYALQARDIVGSAVTGSGKTASFVLPVLERLLLKRTKFAVSRVLVLTPTRELAMQCNKVIENLSRHVRGISTALVIGGTSYKTQESSLRERPDVIIATPGRIVDHLMNSIGFGLEDIEVLILDEADRLLELGFFEQIQEILTYMPIQRQTMLFSATMTEEIEKLIELSLKRPLRIAVDAELSTIANLSQEFIKVKERNAMYREAMLVALLAGLLKSAAGERRTGKRATKKFVVFVGKKSYAHRLRIMLGLLEFPHVFELHGNMSQLQRLKALQEFDSSSAEHKAHVLIATDLASRGLDMGGGADCVINYDMPKTHEIYLHRIGRSGRGAHAIGHAITFVHMGRDRKLLKEIMKKSNDRNSIKQRIINVNDISKWHSRLSKAEQAYAAVVEEEKVEREIRVAEMEANKMKNMMEHEKEIMARPRREWFQSEYEKKMLQVKSLKQALGEKIEDEEAAAEVEEDEAAAAAAKQERKRKRKERRKAERDAEEEERSKNAVNPDEVIQVLAKRQQKKAKKGGNAEFHHRIRIDHLVRQDHEQPDVKSIFAREMKRASLKAKRRRDVRGKGEGATAEGKAKGKAKTAGLPGDYKPKSKKKQERKGSFKSKQKYRRRKK